MTTDRQANLVQGKRSTDKNGKLMEKISSLERLAGVTKNDA